MIPGHGGIMDRFDCQFLMATFVNVYISSFIRTASPQKLLALVIPKTFHISCICLFSYLILCFLGIQPQARAATATIPSIKG